MLRSIDGGLELDIRRRNRGDNLRVRGANSDFNADGRHLGSLLTGQATANCTFDGAQSTLYITADTLLGRLRLD